VLFNLLYSKISLLKFFYLLLSLCAFPEIAGKKVF
jgi:hypothetical protein